MAAASEFVLSLPPNRRQTLGELIAESLRQAVLAGRFRPGDPISEEEIATQLRVSRASVRDALVMLEQERLIVRTPSRRVRVAFLAQEDAEEIYSLRTVLEQLAVRRVVRHDTAEFADTLDALNRRIKTEALPVRKTELDLEFHETLVRAADHERLLEAWLRLRSQLRVVMMHRALLDRRSALGTFRAHQQLIAALRARDERRGVQIIEQQTGANQMDWFRKTFPTRTPQAGSTRRTRRASGV